MSDAATPSIADARSAATRRRPCITSSFQAECVVLTHMLREVAAGHPGAVPRHVPPLPADARLPRRADGAVGAEPDQPARAGAAARLWQTESTEACCARHKVGAAVRGARAATTPGSPALRREQSPSRANLQEVEPFRLPSGKVHPQVSPLAALDDAGRVGVREGARHPAAAALRARLHQHRLRAVHVAAARSRQPRSGRWQGQKLECGIHIRRSESGIGVRDRRNVPGSLIPDP